MKALGVSKQQTSMNLLPSKCINMTYSYYITSAMNRDSQSLEINLMDFMAGVFSGLENQLVDVIRQHEVDTMMRNEFSDVLSATCRYEEVPKVLSASESGYDLTYNFMFSEKSYELIDILVEEDSLFKLFLNVDNPKNNLNAFMYQGSDMKNLLAYTQPSHSEKELTLALKAQKKAYKLKIVYDSMD
jgi:hypothetical protein